MRISSANYCDAEDYRRVRELLSESNKLSATRHNWSVVLWEVLRCISLNQLKVSGEPCWEESIHLWHTEAGKLVGMVNFEDKGEYYLQVHPHFRFLENQMMEWAETYHHITNQLQDNENWPLHTYVYNYDDVRTRLLTGRGYHELGPVGCNRRCILDNSAFKPILPKGYRLRNLTDTEEDLSRRLELDRNVFGNNLTLPILRALRKAATYRPELDLIILTPGGDFAAFCLAEFDMTSSLGEILTLGTHSEQRGQGLATALLTESMRRIKQLGGTVVDVYTAYDSPANYLYERCGFCQCNVEYRWEKVISNDDQ